MTKPVDVASAMKLEGYDMESYTYEYHPQYGSDEMETEQVKVTKAELLSPTRVRLSVDKLRSGGMGTVHELHMPGVKCAAGESSPSEGLPHHVAYYTVQRRTPKGRESGRFLGKPYRLRVGAERPNVLRVSVVRSQVRQRAFG